VQLVLIGESRLVLQGLATLLGARSDLEISAMLRPVEAEDAIERIRPDMVIVETDDVLRVATLLERVVRADARPSVVLIAPREPEQLLTALRIGVDGFVSRDVPAAQLLASLDAVANGEPSVPRSLLGSLIAAYRSLAGGSDDGRPTLSEREREVISLLALGTSARDIGRELYLSESTIRAAVRSAAQKFGVRNRVQVLAAAMRQGLVD
jgi:DNA-binding NarL/FixJ family response regulator